MIESIDHFVITVADVETTLGFYERVLGFTRSMTPGNPAALKFGSQKISVHRKDRTFEPKAKRPTPGAADFCLVAARPLEEIKTHVEKCGVTIEVGPVQRMGARGEMTSIYFRDPDGNLVEVSEYPEIEDREATKQPRGRFAALGCFAAPAADYLILSDRKRATC